MFRKAKKIQGRVFITRGRRSFRQGAAVQCQLFECGDKQGDRGDAGGVPQTEAKDLEDVEDPGEEDNREERVIG